MRNGSNGPVSLIQHLKVLTGTHGYSGLHPASAHCLGDCSPALRRPEYSRVLVGTLVPHPESVHCLGDCSPALQCSEYSQYSESPAVLTVLGEPCGAHAPHAAVGIESVFEHQHGAVPARAAGSASRVPVSTEHGRTTVRTAVQQRVKQHGPSARAEVRARERQCLRRRRMRAWHMGWSGFYSVWLFGCLRRRFVCLCVCLFARTREGRPTRRCGRPARAGT